jgi:hypothetical protein
MRDEPTENHCSAIGLDIVRGISDDKWRCRITEERDSRGADSPGEISPSLTDDARPRYALAVKAEWSKRTHGRSPRSGLEQGLLAQ